MSHTKDKFILELHNYFRNFPEYTIGECMYSLFSNVGNKEQLFNISDEDIIHKLEVTQLKETNN